MFRLAAVYFSLYVLTTQMLGSLLPLPVGNVPELGALPPVRTIVAWAAAHVFRVTSPLVVTGSGSGDKTFDWVHAFCVLVISVLITAVWSILDRLRTDDARLDTVVQAVRPVRAGIDDGQLRDGEGHPDADAIARSDATARALWILLADGRVVGVRRRLTCV